MTQEEWAFVNACLDGDRLLVLGRFWSKCDRSGGPESCWETVAGGDSRDGRSSFSVGVHSIAMARVAYMLTHGPIPPGMLVCHNCPGGDNPRCVNPRHLFLGDYRDNSHDALAKGRLRQGEAHYRAKLTAEQVNEIRGRYTRYIHGPNSTAAMAKEFGVSPSLVRQIVRGRHWKHLT